MQSNISVFESAFNPTPIQTMSVAQVISHVQSDMFREYICSLRTLIEKHGIESKEYKEEKVNLSAFTMSGTFQRRNKREMLTYSGIIQGDIDKLTEDQAKELRDRISSDPHILFGFISPSGRGVKFGFISPSKKDHERQFVAFKDYFLNTYNIDEKNWDDSTKDISKLCFFSWDADAFINDNAIIYDIPISEPCFFDAGAYNPSKKGNGTNRYAEKVLVSACDAISRAGDGERHSTRLKQAHTVGGYVAGGHLNESEALNALLIAAGSNIGNGTSREAERAINDGFNAGMSSPLSPPERDQRVVETQRAIITDKTDNTGDASPERVQPRLSVVVDRHGNEKAHAHIPNVKRMLLYWFGKRLRYEEFQHQIQIDTEDGVKEWDDVHSQKIMDRLQDTVPGMEYVRRDAIDSAVRLVADENKYNGLTNWLDSLAWDGVPRLDSWLIDYVGATDNEYIRCVGRKWLIGAIARAYQPGCKFDYMLVLEGLQGMGKSTLFAVLSNGWFLDDLKSFEGREAAEKLQGTWIVEVAELNGFKKSDSEAIKSFITRQVDRYRPPYAKFAVDRKRSCVFAGTTNQETYLKDVTGNRRFWPVRCSSVNIEGLKANRDQLLAEAIQRYHDGEELTLPEDLFEFAAKEQEARLESDTWEEVIASELETKKPDQITTTEILRDYLGIEIGKQSKLDQMRVGNVMATMSGWCKKRVSRGQKRIWAYCPTT